MRRKQSCSKIYTDTTEQLFQIHTHCGYCEWRIGQGRLDLNHLNVIILVQGIFRWEITVSGLPRCRWVLTKAMFITGPKKYSLEQLHWCKSVGKRTNHTMGAVGKRWTNGRSELGRKCTTPMLLAGTSSFPWVGSRVSRTVGLYDYRFGWPIAWWRRLTKRVPHGKCGRLTIENRRSTPDTEITGSLSAVGFRKQFRMQDIWSRGSDPRSDQSTERMIIIWQYRKSPLGNKIAIIEGIQG